MPELNDPNAIEKRKFDESQRNTRRGIEMPKPIRPGSGAGAPAGEMGGPQEDFEMRSARQLNSARKEKERALAAQTTETAGTGGVDVAAQMASKWALNIAWGALIDVATFIGFFSGLAYLNFHWFMSDIFNSKKFSKLHIGQKLLVGALDLIALFILLIIGVLLYILAQCGGTVNTIKCIIKFGATGKI